MSADPLLAIYDRLIRATEHLQEIKGELLTYYGSDFSTVGGEFDPGSGPVLPELLWRGQVTWPRVRMHTLVGELLHDLRSSLDHLAWQLVLANGGTPVEKTTTFPILRVRPTANRNGIHPPPHIAGGVSPDALTIVDEAQPYQFGSSFAVHPLYVLQELWNIDKHRHVAMKGAKLEGFMIENGTPRFSFSLRTTRFDEYGAEVALVPDNPSVNVDCKSLIRIMIHEPGPGIEMALFEVLAEARTAVATLVTSCEDACF